MEARHIVLTAVFAVHLAVFALLIAVQLTAGSPVSRPLRAAALVLAVPSIGLMLLRIGRRLRGRRAPD